jgi:PAS domain S-box-containing protein
LAALEAATADDAVVCEALDGTITSWSAGAERMCGYTAAEMIGRPTHGLFPDDCTQDERARRARLASGARIEPYRTRWNAKAGVIDVEVTIAPLRDPHGAVAGAVMRARDISTEAAAERELRRATSVLRETQSLAGLGVWEWDLRADTWTWCDELHAILGITRGEVVPSRDALLGRFHHDDVTRLKSYLERARTAATPFSLELRAIRGNGDIRIIHTRARVQCDDTGAPLRMIGTLADVTELRELSARLVFSDRMVSVGTLASGVAHQINNPLAFISTNLDMIEQEIRAHAGGPHWDELATLAAEAKQGTERIRNIVKGLMTFARTDEDQRAPLDVDRVLDLAIGMASNQIQLRARIAKHFEFVPPVVASEARLGQVFLCLLVNAAEAIPLGHADRHEIRIVTGTDSAGYAVIEIRDTGAGIPFEIQGRIFDPFFTTKPVGEGTGLGLSICHGIVRSLGGEITFTSEPGVGSTFRVVLPPAGKPVTRPATEPKITTSSQRRGNVLIVDDEVVFASSLRRWLARDHTVTVVNGGQAALDKIDAGERYDVILCDLMMPDVGGVEVHQHLSERVPDQARRIIFMTGGAFSLASQQFLDRVSNVRFEKPCDLQELRAAIRQLVG